jgi:predicted glycosyltransferase
MTMNRKKRVMFYCQHVLGRGHFIRSAEIVRGLMDFDVCFLNGGEIVSGFELPQFVELINLHPIRSDAEFREIQAVGDSLSLVEIKEIRKQRILAEYERFRPELLVIELFPFGRRKFAFELVPLLERIQADGRRTKVICSLRDILVSKRDQARFDEQVCQTVNQYFDLLLVHSDPQFQRLEETFPRAHDLRCPIQYTGFVTQSADQSGESDELAPRDDHERQIIVSIGGGRVGGELPDCAIEASAMIESQIPHRLQIFAGPYMAEEEYQRLQRKVAGRPNIRLERYTTEFVSLLKRADLSLSMAGYNTCLNIIATGARAIVYPFTGNNNEEQTIRALKLEQLGLLDVIQAHELLPVRLAEMMIEALNKPKGARAIPALDLRGVERTAAALSELGRSESRFCAEVSA